MNTAKNTTHSTVTLTEEAVDMLKEFAHQSKQSHWGLKFADEVSACGQGYNYIIDLVPSPGEQDEVIWSKGIPIYVPKESLSRLDGSVIEYHPHETPVEPSSFLKKYFHVKNPNAKGECPCACGIGFGL